MKNIIGGLLAAAAAVFLLPVSVSAGESENTQWGYTPDGFYYQEIIPDGTGDFQFTPGSDGCFSCEWDECRECFAEMGLKMPEAIPAQNIERLYVDYAADFRLTGISFFGLHCKMRDNEIDAVRKEVFTVEAWADWRPPGNGMLLRRSYAENEEYEYYYTLLVNQPTIEGVCNTEQYWCVRTRRPSGADGEYSLCGSAAFDVHLGVLLDLRAVYPDDIPESVTLYLNNYGSREPGYLQMQYAVYRLSYSEPVTTAPETTTARTTTTTSLRADQTPDTTTTAVPRIKADAGGCYFRSDFENGSDRWQTRNGARIRQDKNNYADGHSALRVTNPEIWESGISFSLMPYALEPGKNYSVRVCVMQQNEELSEFCLYLDTPTDTRIQLCDVRTVCGQWAALETSFQMPHYIPDGIGFLRLYIQAGTEGAEYFVDAAGFWDEGCMPEIDLSAAVSEFVPETVQHTRAEDGAPMRVHQNDTYTYTYGGGGVKDLLGKYFRTGFCASAEALQDTEKQALYRKHFNSVTCKTEMLPENVIREIGESGVTVSLEAADPILKFAEENGLGVRGCALLNGDSMPAEMFSGSQSEAEARLKSYIRETFAQLAENYPALDLYAYDVCRNVLPVYYGEEYREEPSAWEQLSEEKRTALIIAAFRYARAYAPENCKLFLSAENLLEPEQTESVIALADRIREEGDYIDGIAIQGQLSGEVDLVFIETVFWRLASLNLDLQITELRRNPKLDTWCDDSVPNQLLSYALQFSETVTSVTFYEPLYSDCLPEKTECCLFEEDLFPSLLQQWLPWTIRTAEIYDAFAFGEMDWSTGDSDPFGMDISVLGDVNCSGERDLDDAVLLAQFLAESDAGRLSEDALQWADYDLDGWITMSDVIGILQWIQTNQETEYH